MKNSKVIKRLQPKVSIKTERIVVFDIETININGKLYPYAIGIMVGSDLRIFYLMDYYQGDFIEASSKTLIAFIDYLYGLSNNYCLFAHNLGGFDGYFVLKELLGENPKLLIDEQNNIITMSFVNKKHKVLSFRDSYRILPRKLADLSLIYDVEHKKSSFNHDAVTVDLILKNELFQGKPFRDSSTEYLTYDLLSLKEILIKLSNYLLNTYGISLLDCFSTASMAMKIFRTEFMEEEEIPIIPKFYDKILRKAYFGGIVNVISPRGKNLYYYDVNSLYPYAMKKAMPGKLLKRHYGKIDVQNFFGFIYAQIIVPKHLNISYACTRRGNELVSPVGKWVGLYFSEELKAYQDWGYEVKTIFGFEHEKIFPFKAYVDHFYEIKKVAKDGERYITKLLLNGLYGFFGRKPVEEVTEIVPTSKLGWYLTRFPCVYHTFEDKNQAIIKRDIYPSKKYCEEFGYNFQELVQKSLGNQTTNTNVAIAVAVTAYARIRIHSLIHKSGANLLYMDTDSMVTDTPIQNELISEELGDLKDELVGNKCLEAHFVAPKVYGLRLEVGKPIIKAKSIPKNQINYDHVRKIYEGETLTFPVRRLFKDINTLSLLEKRFNVSISRDNSDSKRINVFDNNGNWVGTKPVVLNDRMSFHEYLMHKGKYIPKKFLSQIINPK